MQTIRKRINYFPLLILFVSPSFANRASSRPNSDFFVGRPAPDFKLKDLSGHEVQLTSLRGNIVLINFWASWCGPCLAEIPMLEDISKRFEKKNVIVIGINSEEPEDVVRQFVAKHQMTYAILLSTNNSAVISAYGARGLPTAVVIDKNGVIAAYHVGENRDTEYSLSDDILRVSSSKYVAPQPKTAQNAQLSPVSDTPPAVSRPPGANQNWQPKTAEEFVARGFAKLKVHQNPEAKADADAAMQLRSDWFMAWFLHGRAAYEQNDYSSAIQDFDKVIQERPDWLEAYHYRGLAYSYEGQHQRALPDYQKLIELWPYSAAAYNDSGWAYQELGQFDKAKANLDKAIDMNPDYVRARENRAVLFRKQRNWAAELSELAIILHLSPNDRWASDAREAALQERFLPDSSQKQSLREAIHPDVMPKIVYKIEPQYTDEARLAGVSAVISCSVVVNTDGVPQDIQVVRGAGFGLDENAVRAVSAWRFEPATKQGIPIAYTAHIEVSFRLMRPKHENQMAWLNFTLPAGASRPELIDGKVPDNPKDSSNARLRIALVVEPDGKPQDFSILETTSAEWAEIATREMRDWRFRPAALNGQPTEAKGVLELVRTSTGAVPFGPSEAAQNAPQASGQTEPDPNWQPATADEFLARGYARLRIRKYAEAKADADDALKLLPDSLAAGYLHGRAAYGAKEFSTAIDDFDKLIGRRPDWPDAYRYRGLAYSYSGQHQKALPDYQKAIELNPNSAAEYNALGWAYTQLSQLDLARTNLDKAIELDPAFMLARGNRVQLFGRLGDSQAEQNELMVIRGLNLNKQSVKVTNGQLLQKLQ